MQNDPRDRPPVKEKDYAKRWFITKTDAKRLLAEEKWTEDPENSQIASPAYVSDRGELLLFNKRGRSVLYASRKELMDKLAEFAKRPRSHHVLEGLLPQGPHFIEAVPSLIDGLAKALDISRDSLDYSIASLDRVEQAIRKTIRPRKRILEDPNLFAGIIAYLGEVMRRRIGGRWYLNDVGGGIFEPYVHQGDTLYPCCETFITVCKSLNEGKPLGLSSIALVETSKFAYRTQLQ